MRNVPGSLRMVRNMARTSPLAALGSVALVRRRRRLRFGRQAAGGGEVDDDRQVTTSASPRPPRPRPPRPPSGRSRWPARPCRPPGCGRSPPACARRPQAATDVNAAAQTFIGQSHDGLHLIARGLEEDRPGRLGRPAGGQAEGRGRLLEAAPRAPGRRRPPPLADVTRSSLARFNVSVDACPAVEPDDPPLTRSPMRRTRSATRPPPASPSPRSSPHARRLRRRRQEGGREADATTTTAARQGQRLGGQLRPGGRPGRRGSCSGCSTRPRARSATGPPVQLLLPRRELHPAQTREPGPTATGTYLPLPGSPPPPADTSKTRLPAHRPAWRLRRRRRLRPARLLGRRGRGRPRRAPGGEGVLQGAAPAHVSRRRATPPRRPEPHRVHPRARRPRPSTRGPRPTRPSPTPTSTRPPSPRPWPRSGRYSSSSPRRPTA